MKPRILFVDDDPNILSAMKVSLHRHFKVDTAEGPYEALEQLRNSGPYSIVVSDLRMPGMDGITFLSKVREINSDTVRMMLTGHADLESAMNAVNEGRIFRFLTKPAPAERLLQTLRAGIEHYNLLTAFKEKQRILDEDLRAAAFIQERFLPRKKPDLPTLEVYWKFKPSEYVGGDIFNIFKLDDKNTIFFVTDISGHGVASALLAISVHQSLQPGSGLLYRDGKIAPPEYVLENLDNNFPIERFDKHFTIFYGIINCEEKTLTYGSAGHSPQLMLRGDGSLESFNSGGTVIGLGGMVPFESSTTEFNSGDKLLCYTDGVIEYEDDNERQYSLGRLREFCCNHNENAPETLVEGIYNDIKSFGGASFGQDDITMLCMEMK